MERKIKLGYWEATISIFLNTALFFLKFWIGMKTASIAILADAWHTLSDSFSSLLLILGFKISHKPPDSKHPFGHGRAEVIVSVIIGTLIFVIGFDFILEAIRRFRLNQAANFNQLAKWIILGSIVGKELMAQFAFWAARKSGSLLIRADGWHHRSDALTSLLILGGIFLGPYLWWIDSVMGFLMALLLFYAAYDILKNSISNLLGENVDQDTETRLTDLVRSRFGNLELHHLHCHRYGEHIEVTFHIALAANMRLSQAHQIASDIEDTIRSELNIEATVHIDPI
ncbi:MAG: cation transporter [Candidatus Cloacimonetes bacterium]|nr:cation transporter [Candidatus Cloacimonadota bacterium]